LYGRGYLEVPKCCDDQACNQGYGNSYSLQGEAPQGFAKNQTMQPGRPGSAPNPNMNSGNQRPATPPAAAAARVPNNSGTNVAARPVSAPAYSGQNRNNRSATPPASGNLSNGQRPALIGPLGYDELK
jgi:hypothetical protein